MPALSVTPVNVNGSQVTQLKSAEVSGGAIPLSASVHVAEEVANKVVFATPS